MALNSGHLRRKLLIVILTVLGFAATMAVLVCLALIRSSCEPTDIPTAKTNVRIIRAAALNWQATSSETATARCPTFEQLVLEKHLDTGIDTKDPWGTPYRLTCLDGEISVSSVGPDRMDGTQDDVRVPSEVERLVK